MCQTFSGWVIRSGEILFNALSDSHEELATYFAIHERKDLAGHGQSAAKFEYVTGIDTDGKPLWAEPDKYVFRLDEAETPAWLDDEMCDKVIKFMRGAIDRLIVRDNRKILLGGTWILAKGVKVRATRMCRIVAMDGAQVEYLDSSVVKSMYGSSVVKSMYGSSVVKSMYGSSVVESMSDSSVVESMSDSSVVNEMKYSSKAPREPKVDRRAKAEMAK